MLGECGGAGDSKEYQPVPRCQVLAASARSIANRPVGAAVDALAQVLAGLEVRHVLACQCHRFTGLGIAPLTWRTKMQREAAKAPDLDAIALCQRVAHDLEHLLESELHVLGRQMLLLRRNDLDQFRFCHSTAGPG